MQIINSQVETLEDGMYLFSTPNCPTCEKLKQLLNELDFDITITELNAYEHQEICMGLSLMGTPCMIDYRFNREYDRMYGAPSNARVLAFLKGE